VINPELQLVLRRIKPRFLLFGTFALQVHGFSFGKPDLDLWLDPQLVEKGWRDVIRNIAGPHEILFRDHPKADPPLQSARIHTTPHIDIISRPSGHIAADFDPLYRVSMQSRFGRLPPVMVLLRSKLHAGRPKDYRHVMRVGRQILNIW
jgi:hypothetical protein